jgi:hypothetical protein
MCIGWAQGASGGDGGQSTSTWAFYWAPPEPQDIRHLITKRLEAAEAEVVVDRLQCIRFHPSPPALWTSTDWVPIHRLDFAPWSSKVTFARFRFFIFN